MKLFGFALVSAQYIKVLQITNEEMAVKNENQAGLINALKAELAREQSAHSRSLQAFEDMKNAYNTMEQKYQGELEIANTNYTVACNTKAEIEKERAELQKKYDELNETVGEIEQRHKDEITKTENDYESAIATYQKTADERRQDILDLRAKLSQLQGRLGAYIKKYGDLPHKRENERKRKHNKQHETTQNTTTN